MTHKIIPTPSKFNFEVDSTSNYRESTTLQSYIYYNEIPSVLINDLLSTIYSLHMN